MYNIIILGLLSLVIFSSGEVAQSCSNSYSPGTFTFNSGTEGYLLQPGGVNSWGKITPSGNSITLGSGPRLYQTTQCDSSFSTSTHWWKQSLLNSQITFTVLTPPSGAGCGWDAAFYSVGMPASSAGSNGDYYCDANCVGGACCAEMDFCECNAYALQSTIHWCSSATSGCDANGNPVKFTNTDGYGPGLTINTYNAFTVTIKMPATNGALTGYTVTVSQGSNSITKSVSSSNAFGDTNFGTILKSMVPVWSFWSGNTAWLDSPACSSDNSAATANPSFVFSNLVYSTIGSGSVTAPVSTPTPTKAASTSSSSTSSSTLACTQTSSCTINANWVEFVPPSSVQTATAVVSVTCKNGASCSCTWYSAGGKYQCSSSQTCTTPIIATINNVQCPISSSSGVTADETADSDNQMPTATVAGIAIGCIVGVVLIVVAIIVVVVKKKQNSEYV